MRAQIMVPVVDALRSRLFGQDDWTRLEELGDVHVTSPNFTDPDTAARLAQADVIITGWGSGCLDVHAVQHASNLRAIVHTGGSVRSVATPAVYERGITVSSQTVANSQPVAEFSLALILLAGKQAFRAQRLYAEKRAFIDREEYFPDAGLYRTRIGLVGLSRISRRLIELLAPFDVEVVVFSRHLNADAAAALGVVASGLDDLLSSCDVVSLHSAALPSTQHMIGARELGRLRDGATLVNTARGALIDHAALERELSTGRIWAIIDTTDPYEPLPPDSPLWDLPNVMLTPHFAGAVGKELNRLGRAAVDDVEAILQGRVPAGVVTEAQYEAQA